MQLLPVSSVHKTYQKPIIFREYLELGKNSQNLTSYEIAGFDRPNFFMSLPIEFLMLVYVLLLKSCEKGAL